MKRNLLLTAGLGAVLGLSAFYGIAYAAGPVSGEQGGSQIATQLQGRTLGDQSFLYQYHEGDYEGSEYGERDQLRTRTETRSEWRTMDEAAAGLEGSGYRIRKMETDRYRYETKVTDASDLHMGPEFGPEWGKSEMRDLD